MKRTILNLPAIVAMTTVAITAVSLSATRLLADVTLVDDGRAKSVLVLPTEPTPHELAAAAELQTHLEKMSGAKLDTATIDPRSAAKFRRESKSRGIVPIFIGRNARDAVAKLLPADAVRGTLAINIESDAVSLAGVEEGTTYAALELLEQLGCRWFMPGDLGTVVPEFKTVAVKEQQTTQSPSFPSRHFQMPDRDWQSRVRCGGDSFVGGHGLATPKVKVDKATGEITPAEYADWFALVKGKRTTRQHCLSNPKLLDYVVADVLAARKAGKGPTIGMGPNDGAGFCECEHCNALDGGDFDPFSNEPSHTDRYIWFFNQVLERVNKDYPDTKIAFYIYHSYMRPPLRWKPDPRITGALAPIALDRVHGFSNPTAPEKSYARKLYEDWGKIMPELYDRGYWSNLACPGFPFIIVDRLRDEIPECHKLGVKGWRVETFPNYASQFPSMYVAGKLMWNHKTDVDALLADCYEKFFGPAAKPMGEYITRMDAALRDGDYATGSSWDMPRFYPPAFRAEMRKLLAEGRRLASGQGMYEQRVHVIAQSFQLVEHFNQMMAARVEVDFPTAKAELEKMDAVAEELMAVKPVPMLSAGRFSTYVNYTRRFFRPCTEQGFARVTGGNKLVASAHDEWEFQIDPAKIGEEIGLFRPDLKGGGWQKIRTSSDSWSNQGLRYYKGLAWYRQKLEIPKEAVGKRLFLWCGGVDETAKVWVNGQVIGISPGASFYPFEMDATEAVREGSNTIVMCVANQVVSELGTGGIVAPVILYAPVAGREAKLENSRDLKPTFP